MKWVTDGPCVLVHSTRYAAPALIAPAMRLQYAVFMGELCIARFV